MPFVRRLLGPSTPLPNGAGDQPLEQVMDLGTARSVAIQVRKTAGGATEPVLNLQHSAVLDAEAFTTFATYDGGLYSIGQSALIMYSGMLRFLVGAAQA